LPGDTCGRVSGEVRFVIVSLGSFQRPRRNNTWMNEVSFEILGEPIHRQTHIFLQPLLLSLADFRDPTVLETSDYEQKSRDTAENPGGYGETFLVTHAFTMTMKSATKDLE